MRNTYIRFIAPLFVIVLALAISPNIPSGRLFALQAGSGVQSGSPSAIDSGTGQSMQPGQPEQPAQPDQGSGMGMSPGNNSPDTGINQAGSDNNGAGAAVGQGSIPAKGGTDAATSGAGAVSGGATQGVDANSANQSLPWGSIIISFIVGLVVGGLIFGRRPTTVDRTDIRRSA